MNTNHDLTLPVDTEWLRRNAPEGTSEPWMAHCFHIPLRPHWFVYVWDIRKDECTANLVHRNPGVLVDGIDLGHITTRQELIDLYNRLSQRRQWEVSET